MSKELELELGTAKFQTEVLEEAKELGLLPKEDAPNDTNTTEDTSSSEKLSERVYTEIEKEQMELGWDPNKPNGVSAEEFKRVGQIIEAKRAASKKAEVASKEVQALTMTVKQLVEHNRKLDKERLEAEKRAIDNEREDKIALGDADAVRNLNTREKIIDKAIEGLESQPDPLPSSQTPDEEVSPEVAAYKERNIKWLHGTSQEDKAMQTEVLGVCSYLKTTNPNISEAEAIATIEGRLKERFPHRFENPNKEQAPKVLKKSIGSGGKSQSETFNDFSRAEQAQFLQIKRADDSFTEAEYIQLLKSTGRRE